MSWQRQVDGERIVEDGERIVTCVMAKVDGERIVCVMAKAGGWGENSHLCHGQGWRMGRE